MVDTYEAHDDRLLGGAVAIDVLVCAFSCARGFVKRFRHGPVRPSTQLTEHRRRPRQGF